MRRLAPTKMSVEEMTSIIPLRRFGTKKEIADSCLFLASEGSLYTTGAILVVDGGAWLQSMKMGDF
jgi:peroxisomal 2,4-dienoyl-CoA reductase